MDMAIRALAKVRELPAIEISNKAQMRLFLEELITECLL